MIWKKSDADETSVPVQAQPLPPAAPTTPRNQPQVAQERALIGASIEIIGDLTGDEDLFIEGRVEGRIQLSQKSVTIGKSGRVKADIHGRTIVVMGEVVGNLFGAEQIVLRQSSTVRGNLIAPRVTLEDGSNFKGSIDMSAVSSSVVSSNAPAGSEFSSSASSMLPVDRH